MGANTRFFRVTIMTISENIQQNRKVWRNFPVGYTGHGVDINYHNVYGGYLYLVKTLAIEPYVHSNSTVLEIGPGNGRWTGFFAQAKRVICVDIIDLTKVLYERHPSMNLEVFTLEDDIKLDFIKDNEVDFIFSFDTFVHLIPESIEAYFKEFNRVLSCNGHGVIHYSDWGKYKLHTGKNPEEPGWPRNNLNMMMNHIKTADLTIIRKDMNLLLRDRILIFTK